MVEHNRETMIKTFMANLSQYRDFSFAEKRRIIQGERIKILDAERTDDSDLVVCSPGLSFLKWKKIKTQTIKHVEIVSSISRDGKVYPLVIITNDSEDFGVCAIESDKAEQSSERIQKITWGGIRNISGDGDLHLQRASLEYSPNGDFRFFAQVDYDSALPDDYDLYVHFGKGPVINGSRCRMEEYLHKEYIEYNFDWQDNGIYGRSVSGNRQTIRDQFYEFNCFKLECID